MASNVIGSWPFPPSRVMLHHERIRLVDVEHVVLGALVVLFASSQTAARSGLPRANGWTSDAADFSVSPTVE